MEIVVLDGYVANPGDMHWDGLDKIGKLTVYDRTPADKIAERAANADAVIINKVVLNRSIIGQLPKLKYIGLLATGYNNVDVDACRERGIVVTNVPAYSTDSVAQTVFAHLLNITNHVADYAAAVNDGRWQNCPDFSFSLGAEPELAAMTMGIYGLGNIGRKVAQIANAFGMRVISPTSQAVNQIPDYVKKVNWEEFLAQSDVISVNAPLAADNLHIFNSDAFSKMKKGVILINTSRGPLINEKDLAAALKDGKVGAAGLDVLEQEPPRDGSPLIGIPNCYITPHIAWKSTEARRRLIDAVASNLEAWAAGKPVNVI